MEKQEKVINYKVDDEPETTTEKVLTPKQIMSGAGVDPEQHYLVLLTGNAEHSFKDEVEKEVHMHEGMIFVTKPTGSMPVS